MNKELLKTVLFGVATAMGVAVIVLTILGTLTAGTGLSLLGVGVLCLGIAGLQKQ